MDARAHLQAIIATSSRGRDLDLRSADLVEADLCGLNADGLDLRAANLQGAALRNARLSGCALQGAELAGADGSGAILRMCALDGAHGVGARFYGTRLEDSSAKGADLTRAGLRSAKLTETSFERAVLREAVFDDAEGDGVQFRGADLVRASLIGARLDEADFRGADLSGADLSRGRFHSADFRGAILDGTCFDGADCAGARFDEGVGPHPGTASKDANPPTEWNPWLEPLLKMTKGEEGVDVKALLAALGEHPTALRDALVAGGAPAAEFLERLHHLVAGLDANSNQPPDEWKVWLEPLMKMANEGKPLDLKALLDALTSLTHGRPPAAAQTNAGGGPESASHPE